MDTCVYKQYALMLKEINHEIYKSYNNSKKYRIFI